MDIKRCRSCGAEIHWVRMMSGKKMPVDVRHQTVVVEHPTEPGLYITKVGYTSHFATCPNTDQHRKG